MRQLALTIESPVWEAVRAPAPWIKAGVNAINVVDSSSAKPSPEGEGAHSLIVNSIECDGGGK